MPIVANPPLARALFRLEVGDRDSAEHWQAVAEIISYVWRLQGARRAWLGSGLLRRAGAAPGAGFP